jgi:hypothetical protein
MTRRAAWSGFSSGWAKGRSIDQELVGMIGQKLGDCCGILGRQHERRPLGQLSGDRRDGCRRRMSAHRARVAQAQVDVIDPVEAAEVGAVRLVHVHRPGARPLRHPQHGHAIGHVLHGAVELDA